MNGSRSSSRAAIAAAVVIAVVATLVAALGSVALAAPVEPTISLAALQAKLDAAGGAPLHGYFRTVLSGSTIETITADILSITASGGSGSLPLQLVFFQATDPRVDAMGGIAEGMSGSPMYVTDAGVDKLVGAVSYGDAFAKEGAGLATPIESMTPIESYSAAVFAPLERQAVTKSGVVGSVVVSPSRQSAAAVAPMAGSRVMVPLSTFSVSGLPSASRLFKTLQASLAARHIDLSSTGLGASDSFQTSFVPGATLAALACRGDLTAGGAGTVTYVGGTGMVMGFGHPMDYTGRSGLELANGWVDGVWPSQAAPYKLVTPGAIRGTVTQDRTAGIGGTVGPLPVETTVTARARLIEEGRAATTSSWIPADAIDAGPDKIDSLAESAAYVASARAIDAAMMSGSAVSTTTVVISDGSNRSTVSRTNLWDDPFDVSSLSVGDLSSALSAMDYLKTQGVDSHIVSVDLQTGLSSARHAAEIVDVTTPAGIHVGSCPVRILCRVVGVAATQTVETTLIVPAKTQLTGVLTVTGGAEIAGDAEPGAPTDDSGRLPRTVAEAVSMVNGAPLNSDIVVRFVPSGSAASTTARITKRVGTSWSTTGEVDKQTPSLTVAPTPSRVAFGGAIAVAGNLRGVDAGTKVYILKRNMWQSTATTLTALSVDEDGLFSTVIAGITGNMQWSVVYEGDSDTLGARMDRSVYVPANVRLTVSPTSMRLGHRATLKANVDIAAGTESLVRLGFYYLKGHTWKQIANLPVSSRLIATTTWRPGKGVWYLRAMLIPIGNAANAFGESANSVLVVR